MPIYEYICEDGHLTDRVLAMKDKHPRSVKCGTCPRRATRSYSAPVVVGDFPEHVNISLGMVIKNRAHLKQIQRERNLQDWEPCRNSPGSQLVKERLG